MCVSLSLSLIDRRGEVTEEYLAAIEEDNSNYGATSSVPKVGVHSTGLLEKRERERERERERGTETETETDRNSQSVS